MEVIRIAFKKVGKRYFFKKGNLNLEAGDKVVVETIRGLELGTVVGKPIEIENTELEVKPVIRLANDEDLAKYAKNLDETTTDCH